MPRLCLQKSCWHRWLCALACAFAILFTATAAAADFCSEFVRMTEGEADRLAASLGGEGDMVRLLDQLERIDGCTILQQVNQRLDMRFVEHRRLRAALLAVATIGRGATTDPAIVSAVSALAGGLRFESDREALRAYITDKLMAQSTGEPLAAFVQGHIDDRELQALAAGVTATVAAARWQPPGDQPRRLYVGNEAHKAIGEYYKQVHNTATVRLNNKSIAILLIELQERGIGPAGNLHARAIGRLALRPDIVNLDTREVYEIKPAGAQVAAAAQVARYIAVFAAAGVPLVPGRAGAPGTSGVVPAPGGHYRFHSPQAGVIAYEYRRGDYVPEGVRASASAAAQQPVTTQLRVTSRPLRIKRSLVEKYRDHMAATTGLSGAALVAYMLVSTTSRAVPARNAILLP